MDLELQEIEYIDQLDKNSNLSHKFLYNEPEMWTSWVPKLTTSGLDSQLDEVLSKLSFPSDPKPPSSPTIKKRGRKPIRPNDPIKKKTEEKDKYWLRMFRGYMKGKYPEVSHLLTSDEQQFWLDHLSSKGVPDKGNIFSSYGKKYKNHLFSQASFVTYFQEWFHQFGEIELGRKCKPGSDLWFVFYDYACKELVNYVPVGCSSLDSGDSFRSSASPYVQGEGENIDFCMVSGDNDEIIEFFLN
jgi:hypothetical protein